MNDEVMKILSMLENNKSIISLDCSSKDLDNESIIILLQALSTTNITKLDISNNHIDSKFIQNHRNLSI